MEWGSDEQGVGLIYGPRTYPSLSTSFEQAQAMLFRLQAQGGIFVVAHPCFGTAPWQWGLSYVNGVEAWCRPWRDVPPLWMDRLSAQTRERRDGKLIQSIAMAAATVSLSAKY